MTIAELRNHIEYFTTTQDPIGLTLYVVLNGDGGTENIRLADIEAGTAIELKSQYLEYLNERSFNNEELSYMPISQGDNRKNSAFYYDLEQKPEGLNSMATVLQNANQPHFSFNTDDFKNIKGFIIAIGNQQRKVVLYKHHLPLNLIRPLKVFGIRVHNNRFERVTEDMIKLSKTVDFLQIGNDVVVLSLKTLESAFGFDSIIRSKAAENITAIEELNLLEDAAPLTELINDLRFAKHIMRIKPDSPVMQIPSPHVISFVLSHPPIMSKFRTNAEGTRLKLDTKISMQLFIKLMNDDFLTSTLTSRYYESLAKDFMPIEPN